MSRALYLEGGFRPRATIFGGILMFRAIDAIALIREAHHRRVRVLGVDTFRITSEATEPMIDHMLDMTMNERRLCETDWDEAEAFIRERTRDDFQFEVVLADEIGRQDRIGPAGS